MQVLINAGGKGTRMGECGIEKPMQIIGGKPVILRVVEALKSSNNIDRILVSVSDNTPETERFLLENGIETIHTTGDSFLDDIHEAFKTMEGQFIFMCPSDLPLLTQEIIDKVISSFNKNTEESLIVLVDCSTVKELGTKPSYSFDRNGCKWAISGVSIMDRQKTLDGIYLQNNYMETDWPELALNVNTQSDLQTAKKLFL